MSMIVPLLVTICLRLPEAFLEMLISGAPFSRCICRCCVSSWIVNLPPLILTLCISIAQRASGCWMLGVDLHALWAVFVSQCQWHPSVPVARLLFQIGSRWSVCVCIYGLDLIPTILTFYRYLAVADLCAPLLCFPLACGIPRYEATLYICYSAFWHIHLCTPCTEVASWQMWPAIRGQFLWSAGSPMAVVRVITAGILSPTLPPSLTTR